MSLLDSAFWIAVIVGAIRAATPLAFAALGELVYERAGVLNLGIEGFMLVGALTSVAAKLQGSAVWQALILGASASAVCGLFHALFCVRGRMNQPVTGLALLFLLQGATAVFGRNIVGQSISAENIYPLAFLRPIPAIGSIVAEMDLMAILAILMALTLAWFVWRTRWGLQLRACGESASAAISAGIPITRFRIGAGMFAGALAGIAGAQFSLFYTQQWQENMIAGRGWIALVLVIFAKWKPSRVLIGALLFGGITSLQLNFQIRGFSSSQYLLACTPFVITMVVLAWNSRLGQKSPDQPPAELGKPMP